MSRTQSRRNHFQAVPGTHAFPILQGAASRIGGTHAFPVVERLEPRLFLSGTTFAPPAVITTATTGAKSAIAADLDNDGHSDVISASDDGKLAWYRNDGTGGFSELIPISSVADGAVSICAIDLDGDGDDDVVSASQWDDKVAWYENDGHGNFSAENLITTSADGPKSVYAADLDGDGDADVLSASWQDNKIAWYENDGFANFSAQSIISTDVQTAQSVFAADLDGDGDQDVLSASEIDDKVAWYENLGDAAFGPQRVITTEADGVMSVFAADMDGDADLDVLAAARERNGLSWYRNDGEGHFGTMQLISTSTDSFNCVYVADLDRDGYNDVLGASGSSDSVAWYENNGDGSSFTGWIVSDAIGGARGVFAEDLDSDGDLDVLSAAAHADQIAWHENLLPRVVIEDQYIFYNNSYADGSFQGANDADDNALDASILPVLAGESAGIDSVSGYSKGLNGVMVDVLGMRSNELSASDFDVLVRPAGNESRWTVGPDPYIVDIRPGAGAKGADRITLIWSDSQVSECWLKVTVLADTNGGSLGLAEDYTFSFGSLPGDANGNGTIDVTDLAILAGNWGGAGSRADFNKDGGVDVSDLALLASGWRSLLSANCEPADDLDDGRIDPDTWVTGGAKRGWEQNQPIGVGHWKSTRSEVQGLDGHMQLRVTGPTSGLTYGAEAWLRTVYDFNDGQKWLLNFTWEADVAHGEHYDYFHIQITDGFIPQTGNVHWNRNEVDGTANLLRDPDGDPGRSLTAGLSKTTWSAVITPDGAARLYDGAEGCGSLVHEAVLDTAKAWYFRMMVTDATSSGYPAGDTMLNFYDFVARVQ